MREPRIGEVTSQKVQTSSFVARSPSGLALPPCEVVEDDDLRVVRVAHLRARRVVARVSRGVNIDNLAVALVLEEQASLVVRHYLLGEGGAAAHAWPAVGACDRAPGSWASCCSCSSLSPS